MSRRSRNRARLSVAVGLLEAVLERSGFPFHRGELHPDAEVVTLDDRITERGHVLAEEILDLVVPVELAAHLGKVVDFEHHRLGARRALPSLRDEKKAAAESTRERPQLRQSPVHAQELDNRLLVAFELVANVGGSIPHGSHTECRDTRNAFTQARVLSSVLEVQKHANAGAGKIVTQCGEVRVLRGASDQVGRDGDFLEPEHISQERDDG